MPASRPARPSPDAQPNGRNSRIAATLTHHGNEYVFVLVKLFIASCTPSL